MDATAARRLSFCFARLHDNDHQQPSLSSSFLSINNNNKKSKAFFSFLFSPWFKVFGFFSLSYVVSVNGRSLIPAEEDDDEEEEHEKEQGGQGQEEEFCDDWKAQKRMNCISNLHVRNYFGEEDFVPLEVQGGGEGY